MSGSGQDLLNLLVEKRVISPAQAELARSQSVATGLSPRDFLLKNGWVSDVVLRDLAPWAYREATNHERKERAESGEKSEKSDKARSDKQKHDTVETNESLLANTSGSSDDYENNLARYRAILKDIIGPDNS